LAASRLQRLPALQRRLDRVQDAIDIAVNCVIVEASDPVTSVAQELLSRIIAMALIVGRMSRAVDLDDKLFVATNEIGEIGSDGLLPNELEPPEKTVSKSPPKFALGLGLVLAQSTRTARFGQA
jgi:hypothetical protein